jgi:hypothetical protein
VAIPTGVFTEFSMLRTTAWQVLFFLFKVCSSVTTFRLGDGPDGIFEGPGFGRVERTRVLQHITVLED